VRKGAARRGIRILATLAVLCGGAAGAAAQGDTQAQAQDADDFLIVDCLLPPQIRQLGLNHTFLAPRQAIRTSAHECALRGGEFTRGDAGGPAGLQMWLPAAQNGDPTAETYVGEIFERGLAGHPDYAAAAVWYKRAADQGNARAAIALGTLLEEGQGVPKDPLAAAKLFRRAAGLPEDLPGDDSARVQQLSSQLAVAQAANAAKGAQLVQQQQQLQAAQKQLSQRETDVQRDRDRLAALQKSLAQAQQAGSRAAPVPAAVVRAPNPADQRLAQSLAAREAELAKTQARVSQLQAQIEFAAKTQQSEQSSQSAELARLESELNGARSAINAKQAEADKLRRDLDAAQQKTATSSQQASDQAQQLKDALAARERELDGSVAQADKLRAEIDALQKAQGAQQAEIAASTAQSDALKSQLDAARQSLTSQQSEADRLKQQLAAAQQSGAQREQGLQAKIADLQHEIDARQATIASKDSEISRLKQQVAGLDTTRSIEAPGVTPPPAPLPFSVAEFGHYHALVIGIDNYKKLPQLKTPINDANALSQVLKNDYGFDVVTLIDATRYQILSALNQFRLSLTDKDNLLIYYAGHGQLDEVNQRGYWLPIDAEPDSPADWISNVQITDMLNAMSARQILVVADSCYSGTLTRSAAAAIEKTQSDTERVKWYKVMISKPSRVALTSGGLEPVSDSGGGDHSMFANLLIKTLKANEQVMAAQEVYARIEPAIATAGDNTHAHQVPEYAPIKMAGHEAGDFMFVRHIGG